MRTVTSIWNWIKTHKIAVVVHALILASFGCYVIFLAEPLFARFEIIPGEANLVQMQLPVQTNNMHYSLEKLIVSKDALEIQGYAFIDNLSSDGNHTFIVLKSAKTSYIFDTSTVWANPVTAQYGGPNLNLDWSGFTTTIPLRKIEKGSYTIGVCITKNGITALQYSSKVIIKSNNGVKITESTSKISLSTIQLVSFF